MTDSDETTDAKRAELDTARLRAGFDDFPARVKRAIAQSEKNTAYLRRYIQHGRPNAKWQRFNGAELRKLRKGLPDDKRPQAAFGENVFGEKTGDKSDTVQRWEKKQRATEADFENIVRYLQSEYPNLDIKSILLLKK